MKHFVTRCVLVSHQIDVVAVNVDGGDIVIKRSNFPPWNRRLRKLVYCGDVILGVWRHTRIQDRKHVSRTYGDGCEGQRRRADLNVWIDFITEDSSIVLRIRSQDMQVHAALLV